MSRRAKSGLDASVAERLIDAAEEIYGRHGLEGPSLRQISIAAGTGNNYAVQYHFGDASGLIEAILVKRVPYVESSRARLLAKIKARGAFTTRALLEALVMPLLDCVNERGERSFARFLLALGSAPEGSVHLASVEHLLPVAEEILELLHELNPHVPRRLIRERARLVTQMVVNSVFNRLPPYDDAALEHDLVENALEMASAAVAAPVGEYMRSIVRASEASSAHSHRAAPGRPGKDL